MERIQKVIANSGYCSRRKAEELIKLEKVLVNGMKATIGMQVKNDDVILDKSELIAKYVSSYFKCLTTEKMYLLCLDSACRVISFNLISEGTVNAAPLNIRKIMELSIKNDAAQLILVHNHPSGIVAPSRNDVDATMGIQNIMTKMGMKLSDHIIVGHGDDFFSFRKSDKWKYIFQ